MECNASIVIMYCNKIVSFNHGMDKSFTGFDSRFALVIPAGPARRQCVTISGLRRSRAPSYSGLMAYSVVRDCAGTRPGNDDDDTIVYTLFSLIQPDGPDHTL